MLVFILEMLKLAAINLAGFLVCLISAAGIWWLIWGRKR